MVNCYLIDSGSGFFLVDTGFPVNRAELETELEKAGVKPGNLKLIILTHGDWDHSGNCACLREKYGTKIAMHPADAEKCRTGNMTDNRKITSPVFMVISWIMYQLFIGPKMKQFPFEPFQPDILLEDGQSLADYGLNARIIAIPGHSAGSIAILTDDGSLISGDTITSMGRPALTMIIENEADLHSSIEKLMNLPVKTLYPGHGKTFLFEDFLKVFQSGKNSAGKKSRTQSKLKKICMVTGANSGIGKAMALRLAEYGATVILACRNRERGEKALQEIKLSTQNPNIDLLLMDLSSQKSIRNAVLEFQKKYSRLDVLINNAGVLLFEKTLNRDRMETTLATNLLGPFLLTNLLLDSLKKGAPSRIVNVVSEGTLKGRIDLDNLNSEKFFKPVLAYSQSKQAEILFNFELAERLKGTNITSNCFYPGLVRTNLAKADRETRKETFGRKVMTTLLKFMFIPMEKGIEFGIFLAASKKAGVMNGKYLLRKKNKLLIQNAYDKEISGKLWELCEKWTGVSGI